MSKTIPAERDRLQSFMLASAAGTTLALACAFMIRQDLYEPANFHFLMESATLSLTFGIVVWLLRAATPVAAFCGATVCMLLTYGAAATSGLMGASSLLHSGLPPLVALFVATFLAGRVARRISPEMIAKGQEAQEARKGRNAAQVLANLGAAGFAAFYLWTDHAVAAAPMLIAMLAETTADTVSSELGAAIGGKPFMVTTGRRVEPGTDGAISLLGTAIGLTGAVLIVLIGRFSLSLSLKDSCISLGAGVTGFLFDSLLGATVERGGWMGNDLVNFASNLCAGMVAWLLIVRG